jgi:hypothetical protein
MRDDDVEFAFGQVALQGGLAFKIVDPFPIQHASTSFRSVLAPEVGDHGFQFGGCLVSASKNRWLVELLGQVDFAR